MSDDTFVGVDWRWWVANTGGVVLTGVLAARTGRRDLVWLFRGAVAVHVTEAVYAHRVARRAGYTRSAPRWAAQTLGVGFPSLVALHGAIRDDRTLGDPPSIPGVGRD
jgi:hypothetical protein